MKQIIDDYFNLRYKYLLECSKNILKTIRRTDLKNELVNDAYIHFSLSTNPKVEANIKAGKIESMMINWMDKQVKWNNTQFKKTWVYPDKNLVNAEFDDVESYIDLDDEISEEETLSIEKEFQDKLNSIQITISSLPVDKQILYQDVFLNGHKSGRKLAKHTGISETGCYYLIKELKEIIKNNYNKGII